MSLVDLRKSGDRTPFEEIVDFGTSVNLSGTTVTFWLHTLDLNQATDKVAGATASATDVSTEYDLETSRVWLLSYEPTEPEVTVTSPADYLGEFRVQFAGAKFRRYPKGGFMRVSISP